MSSQSAEGLHPTPRCVPNRAFMTPPKTSSVKTSIMVTLLVVLCSAGNLFFSVGMKRIGALQGWRMPALRADFAAIFTNPWIWLGILSMLLFLAALMLVLSWADYSYVLPATAAMYAITPLLGRFVLGENVTGLRWWGVALICMGVVLVGQTPANTTEG
jgi:drug/metabolite transporter (DMT)-like permease